MRTASAAEWILCRLTTKERAASMVGDLVEVEGQKGRLWFWLSVAGVAISLFWRRPLAFVAAFYAGMWTMARFEMAMHGINSLHRIPNGRSWGIVFGVIGIAGCALWTASLYSAIRYGLQERTTQMALAWAGMVTAVIYFWWQPLVLGTSIATALFLVLVSMLTSKRRMESLVVAVAAAAFFCAYILVGILFSLYQRFMYPGPLRDMREHPSLGWVLFCALILSFWVATTAWSRMREWLMHRQALESRSEML